MSATTLTFTGDKAIDAKLATLQTKVGARLARYALKAGVSKLASAIRKAAPVGPTGNLKKSVGSRIEEKGRGVFVAKTGLNVGKRSVKRRGRMAPHSHLVAIGTQQRYRQSLGGRFAFVKHPTSQQLSTGVMPANPFVKVAAAGAQSSAVAAMRKNVERNLAKELANLK